MAETVLDKFLRYVVIDTQYKEDAEEYPSTAKQFDLLNLFVKELKEIGVPQVSIDKYGYEMAYVSTKTPANRFVRLLYTADDDGSVVLAKCC